MAFARQRLAPFNLIIRASYRYPFLPPFPFSSFSSLLENHEQEENFSHLVVENQPNPNPNPTLDESKVLAELSNTLPIRRTTTPIPNLLSPDSSLIQNEAQIRVSPDGFLPLEDKLRGVFLQKLRGKPLIENALSTALDDDELCIDVVSRVLDRGNLGGGDMNLFFDWAIKQPGISRDLGVYHVILKALGRRKFLDFMVGKFKEMGVEGINPTCETLVIVTDSFVKARYVSRVVEMFGKLEELGMKCDSDPFNVLLRCLCKRSHVGMANSLLNSMKGKVAFDCASYNVVIGGWSRLGWMSEMEKCLKVMVEDGFRADCETYSCLVEGLGRADRIDDAVKIFESMDSQELQPDTCVYNAMICNYVAVGDFDECQKYYEEMLRKNCPPDLNTFTKLISGLLKARKVADALELFDEMLRRGVTPTTGTITSFIYPLCSYGPPHAAMMIYKSARKAGCEISLAANKMLLMRNSHFGKCGTVLKLWNDMQECGYSSDMEVYESVINGLCNNGQLDLAIFVMEEALRKGLCPSRPMCTKLNNKLVAFNKTESAYKLFLKIKEARVNENARRYWRANGWLF